MNGELFTKPLRSAKAKLEYVCGGEEETYCPKFTFMGFRYAELCGIEPENVKVRMKVISSIDEETGDFFCSNESINRLQKNIRYSGFSNFLEIPTDCPQRDERLGWTGDISVFASTACFNFNMNRFLRKWLIDVKAQQTKDGGIPSLFLGSNISAEQRLRPAGPTVFSLSRGRFIKTAGTKPFLKSFIR